MPGLKTEQQRLHRGERPEKRNEAGNNHESVKTCQVICTRVISREQLTVGEMKGRIRDSEWD